MNYLAPGLRELARILHRLVRRLSLVWQRRTLAQLESRLGLLGWQQADYDHGTQQHVDRLTDCERAQGQLTNASADLGLAIHELEERKKAEQAAFEQQRTQSTAARDALAIPVEESEKALAARKREGAEMEERIAALDRESGSVEEKYRALLAKGEQTDAGDAEVQRLQRRVIAIPHEKQEWQAKLAEAQSPIPRLEMELEQHRALLAVETEGLRALEKNFAESDEKLAKEIAARKREKQKVERQINDLEKTKTQPYREIGRALADQGIGPVNQPEALTVVLAQREKIAAQESRIAASLADSAREVRSQVWSAWLVFLVLAVLLLGGAWVVSREMK